MKYLGLDQRSLEKAGGLDTAREIVQQPELWQKVWQRINIEQSAIRDFMDHSLKNSGRIILTGAGTSSFIGLSLRGLFQRETGILTESIPTTDIVTHPTDYLLHSVPTLIISFARSGNSPESAAVLELADKICGTCFHLIITCNKEGKLATYPTKSGKYVFVLPAEANDKSLAMTSSYSSMLLSGILIANIRDFQSTKHSVDTIVKYGTDILEDYLSGLEEISKKDFNRVVFIGAGPNLGMATESHLKVQELTDGKIIGKYDSFLGFRHGPKVVIDDKTIVFYLFSNDPHVLKYERDLVASMTKGHRPLLEVGIMEAPIEDIKLDFKICFSEHNQLEQEYLSVCGVLPAQILGFFKSVYLGIRPDAPSSSGAITRVVEGVQIYALNYY